MRHILLFGLCAATLFGADATGTWTGTLTITGPDGSAQTRPAHLVLKQDGNRLTGTAGPDATEQHAIENGKADMGDLSFEVSTGETVMKFTLKQEGEAINGEITRERDGQKQTAKIAVKRSTA